MFQRLRFLTVIALALVAASCAPYVPSGPEQETPTGETGTGTPETGTPVVLEGTIVRVVAANLSSGSGQSYTPGEGVRILQGTAPDVVLVQEFNYNGDGDGASNEAADFQIMANQIIYGSSSGASDGTQAYYYREGDAGSIPNGVISKYPILDSGEWDDSFMTDRDYAWARIDVPGAIDLYAVSLHIKASSGTADKEKRTNEATQLKSFVAANVPDAAYLVIGGDFNTYSNDLSQEPCLWPCSTTSSSYPPTTRETRQARRGRTPGGPVPTTACLPTPTSTRSPPP